MIQDSIADCMPHKDPLERPDYTEAEVQSLRAMLNGEANARQQVMALDYMIRACGTHDQPYRPGDPQATAFAAGKQFCGQTLVWMLKSAQTRTDPDKIAIRKVDENG